MPFPSNIALSLLRSLHSYSDSLLLSSLFYAIGARLYVVKYPPPAPGVRGGRGAVGGGDLPFKRLDQTARRNNEGGKFFSAAVLYHVESAARRASEKVDPVCARVTVLLCHCVNVWLALERHRNQGKSSLNEYYIELL